MLQLLRSYSYFVDCFKLGLVWFCCVVLLFTVGLGLVFMGSSLGYVVITYVWVVIACWVWGCLRVWVGCVGVYCVYGSSYWFADCLLGLCVCWFRVLRSLGVCVGWYDSLAGVCGCGCVCLGVLLLDCRFNCVLFVGVFCFCGVVCGLNILVTICFPCVLFVWLVGLVT